MNNPMRLKYFPTMEEVVKFNNSPGEGFFQPSPVEIGYLLLCAATAKALFHKDRAALRDFLLELGRFYLEHPEMEMAIHDALLSLTPVGVVESDREAADAAQRKISILRTIVQYKEPTSLMVDMAGGELCRLAGTHCGCPGDGPCCICGQPKTVTP
jgi:hypothetical protein